MKMTFILKGTLELLPPMLPRILLIAEAGVESRLVCTDVSPENRELLEKAGVQVHTTRHKRTFAGKVNKLLDWTGFRAGCKKLLDGALRDSDVLYICSADTALALGSFFTKYPYVSQSNELTAQFENVSLCPADVH